MDVRIVLDCQWVMGEWYWVLKSEDRDHGSLQLMTELRAGRVAVAERETREAEALAVIAAILHSVAGDCQLPGIG